MLRFWFIRMLICWNMDIENWLMGSIETSISNVVRQRYEQSIDGFDC